MPHHLTLFLLAALVTVATPGPTVLLALTNGSRAGLRGAAWGILGAVLSDGILVGTVALGLGALLAASEVLFQGVRWIGVVYLIGLGVQVLRGSGREIPGDRREGASPSGVSLFAKSLLVALTNPKGYLFFSALLPQFLDPRGPALSQYLVLGLAFGAVDGLVMLGYALLGSRGIRRLSERGRAWTERFCGGLLLVLAASLALARRNA